MLARMRWAWVPLLVLVVGCSDEATPDDDEGGGANGAGGSGAGGGSGGGPEGVCARWNADRADMSEGSWSGEVSSCSPGDVSAPGRDNALRLVNLYRFLAALPEVDHDPERNQKAQACALMMDANQSLSHTPPTSWSCYSNDGADAAGSSNIATTPGVAAVDIYMADPGNETTIGHRRWILSNNLGPIGLGSTDGYSCMWVIGGSGTGGNDFTAFPSPGYFPIEAMDATFAPVDETGWTIQSDDIDLAGATVTVTDGGTALPITVTELLPGYGSLSALRFNPDGWSSEAGRTYHVEVTGIETPISYDVAMVACE